MRRKSILTFWSLLFFFSEAIAQWYVPAASHPDRYLDILKGRKVGLIVNHTSMLNDSTHLVDFLLQENVQVETLFAPEHGIRGKEDAGASIESGIDPITNLPIISLYGKNKKPTPEQLKDLEALVFDIQDVGARFYTYISTLQLAMEAAAEAGIPLLVLDRPNPHGDEVDGPVLDLAFQSFVGMAPIPVVHGLTVGELALMINGEGWLKNNLKTDLLVITMPVYIRSASYSLPIKPSPNLPDDTAIRWYPSLCLFEPTIVSVGRGTDQQFQQIGYPDNRIKRHQFTPQPNEGASNPKHQGKTCFGLDLRQTTPQRPFDLSYLHQFYKEYDGKEPFITNSSFFDKLAGTDQLRKQLEKKTALEIIYQSWEENLANYRTLRREYLLY